MRFHDLDPEFTDPARLKRERQKARDLRKSQWWKRLIQKGICAICEQKFPREKLTMDHIVPLARGGTSTKGNVQVSCLNCNKNKGLDIPVEKLF